MNEKKWLKIGIIMVSILLAGELVFMYLESPLHRDIIRPAYMSYIADCWPNGEQIIQSKGYEISGQTHYELVNGTPINPIVADFNITQTASAHEQCHLEQIQQHRLYSCKMAVFRFFNEVECYWRQKSLNTGASSEARGVQCVSANLNAKC